MLNLIRNEWMKLWQKKGTWIMAVLLVLILIGASGVTKWSESNMEQPDNAASPEESLAENKELLMAQMADPNLDVSVKKQLEEEIAIINYRLDQNQVPSEDGSRQQHLLDSHVLLSMVTLFAVIVAGTIVSAEFSQGTIKMLLSRPVKRWKVLTSKYIASLLYALLLTILAFLATMLAGYLFYSSGSVAILDYQNNTVVEVSYWGRILALYSLQLVGIIIYTTFAFMIGSIFRSSSLAIGLSIFLLFVGPNIVFFLSDYEVAKYIIFAHTDLTGFITGQMLLPGITWPFSIAVLSLYMLIFLTFSYLSFLKSDVKA